MLTVDFARLGLRPGELLLDVGAGQGRHSLEALRRGARAIAVDMGEAAIGAARAGEVEAWKLCGPLAGGRLRAVRGDATRLPFADASADRVVAAEVMEHIPDDAAAMAELTRVLRPGGVLAVTVPRRLPERICWALSGDYHSAAGGHVRIYSGDQLRRGFEGQGLRCLGGHHAHGLHSPYWWLRCALGVDRDRRLTRLYHRVLVWDLMRRPLLTRLLDRALTPLIGKSLVLYFERPAPAAVGAGPGLSPAAGPLAAAAPAAEVDHAAA